MAQKKLEESKNGLTEQGCVMCIESARLKRRLPSHYGKDLGRLKKGGVLLCSEHRAEVKLG